MLKQITLLLPFLVSVYWTIVFFAKRKQNARSQNIWMIAIGLIAASVGITTFYWYVDGNYSLYYKLDILEPFFTLSFIPVLFLYFKELTGDKNWSPVKIALLLLPTLLYSAANVFFYLSLGEEQAATYSKVMIESNGAAERDFLPFTFLGLIINEYTYSFFLFIQAAIMLVYALRRLMLYRKQLDGFFSNMEGKDMEHHWSVFYGLLTFLTLLFVISGLGYMLYVKYDIWISIFRILFAGILYYMCYHADLSHYTAEKFIREIKLSDDKAEEQGYAAVNNDEQSNSGHLKLLPKFNYVIDEDKIFLQKNLRIDDVAALVYTNRTYISRILKDEYNCSFWEFINGKRIEYAKKQVSSNPTLTVEELAEMCGFSHGSTFSRAFRKCEGITYSEWHKRLEN